MKKLIFLLPLFFIFPISGIGIIEYESIFIVYFVFIINIIYAGNNRKTYMEKTLRLFLIYSAILLIIRISAELGLLWTYKIKGYYHNKNANNYFILFSIITLLILVYNSICFYISTQDRLKKICSIIISLMFVFVILIFLINCILNTELYDSFVLYREMMLDKVFNL